MIIDYCWGLWLKHLAYEYARRGARLALVARRKQRLQEVADVCEIIGSPETVYILGDVSNIDDCKRFVDATVNHFGKCKKHCTTSRCNMEPLICFFTQKNPNYSLLNLSFFYSNNEILLLLQYTLSIYDTSYIRSLNLDKKVNRSSC